MSMGSSYTETCPSRRSESARSRSSAAWPLKATAPRR